MQARLCVKLRKGGELVAIEDGSELEIALWIYKCLVDTSGAASFFGVRACQSIE
jgi:hypothetical protein